jgi:hypothetical protein
MVWNGQLQDFQYRGQGSIYGQVPLPVFQFSPANIIPPVLLSHIHLSVIDTAYSNADITK